MDIYSNLMDGWMKYNFRPVFSSRLFNRSTTGKHFCLNFVVKLIISINSFEIVDFFEWFWDFDAIPLWFQMELHRSVSFKNCWASKVQKRVWTAKNWKESLFPCLNTICLNSKAKLLKITIFYKKSNISNFSNFSKFFRSHNIASCNDWSKLSISEFLFKCI